MQSASMAVFPATALHVRTPGIISLAHDLRTLLFLLRSAARRLRRSWFFENCR